mmetsp:Transcript_15110/g.10588  ORF Transcript_15110/g.10588 Transcript_15110/m.10588 type:complete len:110 (+) Transcript_15110:202-531(+)
MVIPMIVVMIGTYVNARTILMLRTPDMFDVAQEDIGMAASSIMFFATFGSMIAAVFIGYIYDILGRKMTIFLSLSIASVVFIILPFTAPSYPLLIVLRVMFTMCIQAPI